MSTTSTLIEFSLNSFTKGPSLAVQTTTLYPKFCAIFAVRNSDLGAPA